MDILDWERDDYAILVFTILLEIYSKNPQQIQSISTTVLSYSISYVVKRIIVTSTNSTFDVNSQTFQEEISMTESFQVRPHFIVHATIGWKKWFHDYIRLKFLKLPSAQVPNLTLMNLCHLRVRLSTE